MPDLGAVPVSPAWFDAAPEQVAAARTWLRGVVSAHRVDPSLGAQAELLLSELVTNVILHSWSVRVGLAATVTPSSLTVSVIEDRVSGLGRHARPQASVAAHAESRSGLYGRGLGVLDWLASEWGTRRRHGVTTSWFTVQEDSDDTADCAPTSAGSAAGPHLSLVDLPSASGVAATHDRSEQYLLGLTGGLGPAPQAALYDYLRDSLARSELLLRLTEKLGNASTPEEVGEVVTDVVRDHLGAVFSGIALIRDDGCSMHYLSLNPLPEQTASRWSTFPLDRTSPAGAAALDTTPYFHPTVAAAEREFPGLGAHMRTAGTNALAHLPLTVGGRTIGTLCLAWRETRDMDPDLRALLLVVAGYAAHAITQRPQHAAGPHTRSEHGSARFEWRDGQPRLLLTGEIDFGVTDGIGDDDIARFRAAQPIVVDLTEVTFMDSAGISLLLRIHNVCGEVRLVHPSPKVRKLLAISGLDDLLGT